MLLTNQVMVYNENSNMAWQARRAFVIVLACTLAVLMVRSISKDEDTTEYLIETSSGWARTVINKALETTAMPTFPPDVSAAESGFEAADEASHLFHLKGQAVHSFVPTKHDSHTIKPGAIEPKKSTSEPASTSDSKKVSSDDKEYLKGIRLYPFFPARSPQDAAAQPLTSKGFIYRPAPFQQAPSIVNEHYQTGAPIIVSGVRPSGPTPPTVVSEPSAPQTPPADAQMVEVPIPLDQLTPPSAAVAGSFPTPFTMPAYSAAPPSEGAGPFFPPAEGSDSPPGNSYQVKVKLPAAASPYGTWSQGGVGSINVNFAAAKADEGSQGDIGRAWDEAASDEKREWESRVQNEEAAEEKAEEEHEDKEAEKEEGWEDDAEKRAEEEEVAREREEVRQDVEEQADSTGAEPRDVEAPSADLEREEPALPTGPPDIAAEPLPATASGGLPVPGPARFEEPAGAALWSYTDPATGPERWGELGFSTCGEGRAQSPVNIELDILAAGLPPLAWRVPEASGAFQAGGAEARVVYNGRAVEVAGLDAVMAADGAAYQLRQMHVHTPSEHTVGGQHYDMEVHFVHAATIDGRDRYMIVAALFTKAEASADFIAGLAAALPSLSAGGEAVRIDFPAIAMAVLGQEGWCMHLVGTHRQAANVCLPGLVRSCARTRQMEAVNPTTTNAESYYAYDGSFTAPPCAEGVSWRVLKNPLPVAAADLAAFTRLQGKNDRPTQPLNGRSVLDSSLAASQL